MGDIVTSPHGDAVVCDIKMTPFGFPIFDIEVLQTGQLETVNRIAISKITDIQELTQEVSEIVFPKKWPDWKD